MKANSHHSFNFAELLHMLSNWPNHGAHTKQVDTKVSRPLEGFLLYFPNCAAPTLSLGARPRCTGGVRRCGDTFAELLSLCARSGWHQLPGTITHPTASSTLSGEKSPTLTSLGQNWEQHLVLMMISPVLLITFHSPV